MNLEQLVPPLELCKQIPAGAFADSALVYLGGKNTELVIVQRSLVSVSQHDLVKHGFWAMLPAPTLQEIMEALPTRIVYAKMPFYLLLLDTRNEPLGDWQIGYAHEAFYGLAVAKERRERDKHPPTAALRLWLQLSQVSQNSQDTQNSQGDLK